MKKVILYILSFMLIFSACKTSRAFRGGAIGTGTGAVIGGVIGKTAGNTALGAVIGAAVGGATGAVIGRQMDKQAEEIKNNVPNAEVIHKPGEEGIIINFNSGVLFAFNKADLTPASIKSIEELATILNKYPDTDVLIEGHTDDKGSDDYNLKLSEKRADAVSDYLRNKNIPASRLRTVGYGEKQPVASNDTEQGRSQNRRVTFVITANEKMKAEAKQQAKN
ncbi:MAG TPA: OmpA family protein [Bacteroidales bacterium]|nr:OmpA family protein [Bacteroidales bacterium]